MLPALMRAEKVGKKASCFDFADASSVMDKLREETEELENAMSSGITGDIEEEVGDLLLTVTSLCRKLGVESEIALNKATEKFICRFEAVENEVNNMGLCIENLSMKQLDAIWDKNKAKIGKKQ